MTNIRQANTTDLKELAQIYAYAYNSLNIGENWNEITALALIRFLYENQPDLFFVAEIDNKIIGGIVASIRPWWDGNHLIDGEVFVNPDYQKKGIGINLIKKLLTTAKNKYKAISWDTYTHTIHTHPLKWYKSIGFEEPSHWTMIVGDIEKVLNNIEEKLSH